MEYKNEWVIDAVGIGPKLGTGIPAAARSLSRVSRVSDERVRFGFGVSIPGACRLLVS